MRTFIPLSVPNIKGNEKAYVVDALEKEWVSTGGSYIERFEEEIAKYVHVEHAVACQSGTAGLHLALRLSDVQYGDEVIVPTLTFIAAVNPIKYLGANAIFMDCDDTLTIDIEKLESFCREECEFFEGSLINKKSKKIIKAIVVVHVFGNMANMERIMKIAKDYNLKVIEDATEALGTFYIEGKYAGRYAGTIGDFGVYSFNGNKIITTGGGGMIVSTDTKLLEKAKYLSTQAKDDMVRFIHNEIGYNYRMTNVQAAIGLGQLERLEEFIEIKENNYKLYSELIGRDSNIKLLKFNKDVRSNYWFYSLLVLSNKVTVEELMDKLHGKCIQTRPIWGLIHEQIPYRESECYKIEKAKYYQKHILNIPCSSNLQESDVEYVVKCIASIIREKE